MNFRYKKSGIIVSVLIAITMFVFIYFLQLKWIQKFCANDNSHFYKSCNSKELRIFGIPTISILSFFVLWYIEKFIFYSKKIIKNLTNALNSCYIYFENNKRNNLYLSFTCVSFMIFMFFHKFGFYILNPMNINWIVFDDLAQHYFGWAVFRNEEWTFPLGDIKHLNYPYGSNIGFTDSLPLLGIFFKLFKYFLPANFQYIGIFVFICYFLQGFFSYLIARNFRCHLYLKIISSILISLSPPLLWRFGDTMQHENLLCHWLILGYLYILLKDDFYSKKRFIFSSLIILLSAWIHPYMTFLIMILYLYIPIKSFIENKSMLLKAFSQYIFFIVIIFSSWYIIGYFNNYVSSSSSGFGNISSNINSFFNSFDYSRFLKALPIYDNMQYEGYSYLGLGLIILFFIVLSDKSFINLTKYIFKNKKALMIPIFICYILAITNKMTFNDFSFEIPINQYLGLFLNIFRSSGRFIWPVYYIVVIFIIRFFIQSKRVFLHKFSILLILFVIQIIDLQPIYSQKSYPTKNYQHNLDSSPWLKYILNRKDKLIFYNGSNISKRDNFSDFWQLSALYHIYTNIGYFARDTNEELIKKLNSDIEKNIILGNIPLDTLYILDKDIFEKTKKEIKDRNIRITRIDNYFILQSTSGI